MPGASAKPALLGPMSSDCGDTWTHTLVAEPYSSVQVRTGALQAVLSSVNRVSRAGWLGPSGTVTSRRGRETHRHDYMRLPSALSDELAGLSTSLGLSASPLLILWTESVVVRHGVEGHEHGDCNAVPIRGRMPGASAKPALLGPMSSDCGDTWTHTLVAEPYSSVQVRTGALQAVVYSRNRVMCSLASRPTARSDIGRGRETHAQCY